MKLFLGRNSKWTAGAVAALALCLPIAACAEPTNGPLVALGLTNTPIGNATLEIIEGGVLFVGNTEGGSGVSVQLGEADSGVFLYPLTGDLYEGDLMEGKAYGRVNGVADQFISSVLGIHSVSGSVTVTVDFSALGASRLSVFAGTTLLGHISNATAAVWVQGNGYGCRANPWWRLPDGSFGALIELADTENSISISPVIEYQIVQSNCIFIRPDDPTNSVEWVSRVDVTSSGLGSFCLTDARLGVFHQRHKALGQATLYPAGGQLLVGNLISNIEDGVAVSLASVSGFNADLLPLELTGTNATVLINGIGTSDEGMGSSLGTVRIDNGSGVIRIGMETALAPQTIDIVVRSNGVVVGSVNVSSSAAFVDLSGNPRITGCSLPAKTMETLPGFAVRVDRLTTFTASSGQTLAGDEVRWQVPEPVFFESLETLVVTGNGVPSFTITGESETVAPPPALNIACSTNSLTLSWSDPNRSYSLEAAAALSDEFVALPDAPAYANNRGQLTLSTEGNGSRFFRLRRHVFTRD